MSASNHRRSTGEVVNAIVALVTALKLADTVTPAFERVELFDSEDLVAAFEFLLITEQRVCVVVPLTEEFPTVFEGLKMTVKRKLPVAILCSDRVLGSRKEALWGAPAGDVAAPGGDHYGVDDLVHYAGLTPGARYQWTPGDNEGLISSGTVSLNEAGVFVPDLASAEVQGSANMPFTGSLRDLGISTPGAMALAELALPAVTGLLLQNPGGVICVPERITILTVKDTEKNLPSRITAALEVECRGGWMEARLEKGQVL